MATYLKDKWFTLASLVYPFEILSERPNASFRDGWKELGDEFAIWEACDGYDEAGEGLEYLTEFIYDHCYPTVELASNNGDEAASLLVEWMSFVPDLFPAGSGDKKFLGLLVLFLSRLLRRGGRHYPPKRDVIGNKERHRKINTFLSSRVRQHSYFWFAIRPFFIGGSQLAAIFQLEFMPKHPNFNWEQTRREAIRFYLATGKFKYQFSTQYGDKFIENQALKQLCRHVGLDTSSTASTPPNAAMRNGTKFEGLGRELHMAITHSKIIEAGTAISHHHCGYMHSPDGLILDPTAAVATTTTYNDNDNDDDENDNNTTNTVVGHPGAAIGLIEIKFHSGETASGFKVCDKIPPRYLMQCLQGIIVHKVKYLDFVSLRYDPRERDEANGGEIGEKALITIERISYDSRYFTDKIYPYFDRMLDTYIDAIHRNANNKHHPSLPNDFYKMQLDFPFTEREMATYLDRKIVNHQINGVDKPVVHYKIRLSDLLPADRVEYWKSQRLETDPPRFQQNGRY